MDAQRDAVLIMIGLPSTRVAALAAGSVDATIAIPPDNVLLRQKGFRELLFLGDAIEFPSNGFTTTERQLSEKRDLTKRLLRATLSRSRSSRANGPMNRSRSSNGNGASMPTQPRSPTHRWRSPSAKTAPPATPD